MERSSPRAEWQEQLENELNQTRTLRIFNNDDNSDDGLPNRELPIFTRNEKIWQELDARQRKRKIEAEDNQQAWSWWDQRQAVLVQRYDNSTQEVQRPNTDYQSTEYQRATQRSQNHSPARTNFETSMISIDQSRKETTHNGVALTIGT